MLIHTVEFPARDVRGTSQKIPQSAGGDHVARRTVAAVALVELHIAKCIPFEASPRAYLVQRYF